MKLRTVTAAMALVLATAGLSACTTHVGVAATINGQRVTDSDLVSYLTPKASVISAQTSTNVPVRSFVLEILIEDRLLTSLAKRLKPAPTEKQIQAEITRELASSSAAGFTIAKAKQIGFNIVGFKAKFNGVFAHFFVLNEVFQQISQQQPALINQLFTGLKFPVSVSPAYGSWDAKNFSLNSGPNAGYPSFMKLASSAPATPGS